MDNSNTVKDYISPSKSLRTVAWVLFALTLVTIVLGATTLGKGDSSAPVKFDPFKQSGGEYAYIDVVGLSDWLYKVDSTTYYTAMDADGYTYIITLSASDLYRLSAQRTWWDSDDTDNPPEPVRLTGKTSKITSAAREAIQEVWDMGDAEYSSYFGKLYLITTTTPAESRGGAFIGIGVTLFIAWFGTALSSMIMNSRAKKAVNSLMASGNYEKASSQLAAQLMNEPTVPQTVITDDYIFTKGNGVVTDLSTIRWIFRRIQRYNFVKVGEYLIGKDSFGKEKILMTYGKNTDPALADRIIEAVRAKVPDLLIGYDRENMKAYNEYRKQVKNGNIPA